MRTVYLISGDNKRIMYKERLGCGDKDMIMVRTYDNKEIIIPKTNVAYIEE